MVYRIYVEKKAGLDNEARALQNDLRELLGIKGLEKVRLLNRYDCEGIDEDLFDYAVNTVFSEPQLDDTMQDVPEGDCVFAVEYLPGQFDQRAASASECIQLISKGERPLIRSAKVYVLTGTLTDEELEAAKKYVINPVEAREAAMELPETLEIKYEIPTEVDFIENFRFKSDEELQDLIDELGLAMDLGDLIYCREYFLSERREPTITEIRMIDTYWSDHCRHTTFNTIIDKVTFEDDFLQEAYDRYIATREELNRTKPVSLMDIGTLAAKALKAKGLMDKLDESEEINACTIKMKVDIVGEDEPEDWLLLFKNETHNHPTEIEPFGGAATCIGGAIRDPLSGRSYVYGAMRVTGAGDPLKPVSETIPGKLPQRKLVTTAAAGYSSYGNQIGLATGQVDEIYHPGYVAKRMEVGAVIAAAPAENVIRETPEAGDLVILLGGKTGRDGCGGATGSSKSHNVESLESCGAEVQKGNAPEERKLQRLFRNPEASRMIIRCNDFGAGGVSVAIGELADGLDIDLNKVPKKYEGLDGTELAISESQERMAVVVRSKDAQAFMKLAEAENLEATVVAEVTDTNRLVQVWNEKEIVDISRDFLNSNGAEKHITAEVPKAGSFAKEIGPDFAENFKAMAGDLNVCSKRGLSERFDSTIGAGTVLMPFGGKYQRTPIQAMVNKISVEEKDTRTVSFMSYGYNPYITEKSPYHGAYLAVVESISKLVASGAEFKDVYLSFQEYFEKLGKDPEKWGVPLAAVLGAFDAQMDMGAAAIGGKDSMSGTFEDIHVPPTLISFAVTTGDVDQVVTPEFKLPHRLVVMVKPELDEKGLPTGGVMKKIFDAVYDVSKRGLANAIYTPGYGGAAEAVLKMAMGNMIGFKFNRNLSMEDIFGYNYGSFIIEVSRGEEKVVKELLRTDGATCITLGETTEEKYIAFEDTNLDLDELLAIYEGKLESVYPCNIEQGGEEPHNVNYEPERKFEYEAYIKNSRPKVLIPVFPGTNCEYDTAKAFREAGAEPEIFVINNLTSAKVAKSVEDFAAKINKSQMIFVPGGFSGGDEPDGSGKFITAFFRNPEIKDAVTELLEEKDGLMAGICNGFQALIKLGLLEFGKIVDTDSECATLTFNKIARHQSKIVNVRVASVKSPWLTACKVGDVYQVPISHGEGRFMAPAEVLKTLESRGQIMTQYVDFDGNATNDIQFNPNGSDMAIEGLISPEGRVIGKMGHSERRGYGLYKNVPGNFDMKLFESAVKYFK
ncbi:MAG: phosphoribosylformylglycinamidine synthase [Firmicutes bacterium]|nr:phosphoribosylformylglycinamidine synthase [Bacillota bacterium]